jgi:hypothetical protein
MNTTVTNATEYRDLPLAMLTESSTNPRRIFEDAALKELADFVPLSVLWPRTPKAYGNWRSAFRGEHSG